MSHLKEIRFEEIEKRFQQFQNQLNANSGPSSPNPQNDLKIKPKTNELVRNDSLIRSPVKYDFVDNEWIGKPSIMLTRYSDQQIATIGRVVIPMLSSGFTGLGVSAVFVLAYHLKAPGSDFRKFVFNPDENVEMIEDRHKQCSGFWIIFRSVNCDCDCDVIRAIGDCRRESAVYSYIAVSLFRLFARPVSSYMNSWCDIVKCYSRYYKESMTVKLPVPTEFALKYIKDGFYVNERAKVTLYRFLYMSNSDERYKDLKRFLYDIQLSYSGLHIVKIVRELCDVFNCSPGLIVTAINGKVTNKQMKCLVQLLKLLTRNDENHLKKMWRYGRIFDYTFLSDIQTKSCQKLVYVLAEALKSEAPKKHSHVLQIAQLADFSMSDKTKCAIEAHQILTHIKRQILQNKLLTQLKSQDLCRVKD